MKALKSTPKYCVLGDILYSKCLSHKKGKKRVLLLVTYFCQLLKGGKREISHFCMQIENTKLRVVNEVSNMNMLALPLVLVVASVSLAQGHLPVVIWHGMGDNCCHDFSMGYIKQVIEDNLPGVYVRSLMVSKLS